ncbi:MAG: hypothetical protein H7340_01235 [Variovorax sp.]|nr:hypothetical protein [Variovorax sp.]
MRLLCCAQHATAHLDELNALKKRFEVAVAKAFITLALNEFEEDRTQLVLAEDPQQQSVFLAVDQDFSTLQLHHAFAMLRNPLVDQRHALAAQGIDDLVKIVRTHRDVLDAFTPVRVQVRLNLAALFSPLFGMTTVGCVRATGVGPYSLNNEAERPVGLSAKGKPLNSGNDERQGPIESLARRRLFLEGADG